VTNLLQITRNIRKCHRQLQIIATRVRRWCVLRLSWSSRFFMRRKCERALRLVYPPFSCKIRYSSNLQNKNLTDSNSFKSVTIQNVGMNFSCHSDQHCRLPKYWPLLLNHPVWNLNFTDYLKAFCGWKSLHFLWWLDTSVMNKISFLFEDSFL